MQHRSYFNDRRKYPRFSTDLPLEYRESDKPSPEGGLVRNLSEIGMLIYSIRDIPIGPEFKIVVFFPNGFVFDGFGVNAKAVWKDFHYEADWKGYKYGLQFVQILEEDRWKLLNLLGSLVLLRDGVGKEEHLTQKFQSREAHRADLGNSKDSLWQRIRRKMLLLDEEPVTSVRP